MILRNRRREKAEAQPDRASREDPHGDPAPYKSHDDMLHAARQIFLWRSVESDYEWMANATRRGLAAARRNAKAWARLWHASLRVTGEGIYLLDRMNKARLNRIEREILALLVLSRLGLVDGEVDSCDQILRILDTTKGRSLPVIRMLSEEGKLFKAGLIIHSDLDGDLKERRIFPDHDVVESALRGFGGPRRGWPVKTEAEFLERLARVTRAFKNVAEAVEGFQLGHADLHDLNKHRRIVDRMMRDIDDTIGMHPGWRVSEALVEARAAAPGGRMVVLALLGKELGHLAADDDLFLGRGLTRIAARTPEEAVQLIWILMPESGLLKGEWISPCGGLADLLDTDSRSLSDTEFELTDKAIEKFGIKKNLVKARQSMNLLRQPRFGLGSLVLTAGVKKALDMAFAQARNANVIMDDWGLGDTFAYGRSVTLLFSGPPGTGKTACAEALAFALNKPILVADYSRIQNCFVGQTEKNIVKTFREARAAGAVLFWDEADAMFYDRDSASKSWEVRDVNVLLQEIEIFEGVCVLATNRKISLDKALERRISMKVEFERPDWGMRRSLWEKLVPPLMPVADDVDFNLLCEADLAGGGIKNAVLNAARMALARSPRGPLIMADFLEAVRMETEGSWAENRFGRIGFDA